MPIRKIGITSLILWLLSQTVNAYGVTVSDYLPLDDGNTWSYRSTGTDGVYEETDTVLPGTTIINGVETKAVKTTGGPDSGMIVYITNDEYGIRAHAGYFPSEGWIYYEPPLVLANRTMNLGEAVNSSGVVRLVLFGYGTYYLNYESSNTIEAVETVTVPAGSYETIRSYSTERIYGYLLGEWFELNQISTDWDARYIGGIKGIYHDSDGSTNERLLISTNVQPPPAKPKPFFLPFLPLLLD